mgnify:CR=1 FL=1
MGVCEYGGVYVEVNCMQIVVFEWRLDGDEGAQLYGVAISFVITQLDRH